MIREFRFPPVIEFVLVLGITYGLMVVPAVWGAVTRGVLVPVVFSDERMVHLVLFELATGGLALLVLRLNRWQWCDFGPGGTFRDLGMALLLVLAVIVWNVLASAAIRFASPESSVLRGFGMGGKLSLPVVLLVSAINPLFEEGILLGYVMKVLRPEGFGVACGVSLLFRLSTHLYQGPVSVISILPLGLIFSGFFWRYKRLWPVVIAHMILDVLPLLRLV